MKTYIVLLTTILLIAGGSYLLFSQPKTTEAQAIQIDENLHQVKIKIYHTCMQVALVKFRGERYTTATVLCTDQLLGT